MGVCICGLTDLGFVVSIAEEVEQVLIYNEMLKGQVGELLETLESQESQNDMLLCEVESQQKQMKSMIDVRT